jgi:hypothetical protein
MQQQASYPEVYTVEEFAKLFKLSPGSVRTLIRKGEIPAIGGIVSCLFPNVGVHSQRRRDSKR